MADEKSSGKGKPRRAGKRKGKIAYYWEFKHPVNMAKRAMRVYNLLLDLTGDKDLARSRAHKCAAAHGEVTITKFLGMMKKREEEVASQS